MNPTEQITDLQQQLERAQQQAAAMREALSELCTAAGDMIQLNADAMPECQCCSYELHRDGTGHRATCLADAILNRARALSTDAGSDYISRESVAPLVEALVAVQRRYMLEAYPYDVQCREKVFQAVRIANELGIKA